MKVGSELILKKLTICFVIILFSVCAVPAYAAYSSRAYGGTSNETFLDRTFDWFATFGKSQEEQYRIRHERRTMRKIKRAKKKIEKQKRDFVKKRKTIKR